MQQKIIIWDYSGTIAGPKDPSSDKSTKVILPGVEYLMNQPGTINIICSGSATPNAELRSSDPEKKIEQFSKLMEQLPIKAVAFSPARGGTDCWLLVKDACCGKLDIRKAHEDERYQSYVGQFRKPGIGMLVVIQDLLIELDTALSGSSTVLIGDTAHDQDAAQAIGIPFIPASYIHGKMSEQELRAFISEGVRL